MRKRDSLSVRLAVLLVFLGVGSIAFQVISLTYPGVIALLALCAVFQVVFLGVMIALAVWRLYARVPTALHSVKEYWSGTISIPTNQCPTCGYDLTGNMSGVCPECGTELAGDGRPSLDPANRVDPKLSMIGFLVFSVAFSAGVVLAILFTNKLRSLGIVLTIMCGVGALACLVDRLGVRNRQRRERANLARNHSTNGHRSRKQ